MKKKNYDKDLDLFDVLDFCCGAISDAIHGGLKKEVGEAVINMVREQFERHDRMWTSEFPDPTECTKLTDKK